MGNIGIPELILIFIIALVVFGPRKLPELGRTLGKALGEFRKASNDFKMAMHEEMRELERHTQELEAKAREATQPPENTVPLPDGTVGSGSIDPQQQTLPLPEAQASDSHPEEKPADGDSKPA